MTIILGFIAFVAIVWIGLLVCAYFGWDF